MTLETTDRIAVHVGNGAATDFPYTFPIYEAEDVVVYLQDSITGEVTDTLSDTDYSITGIGNDAGGHVTYTTDDGPLGSEFKIVIERLVPYKQPLHLENYGGFYPKTVEEQLDRIVMQTQQLNEEVSRASKSPAGEPAYSIAANLEDGDVLMKQGSMFVPGPTVNTIANAEQLAEQVRDNLVLANDAADRAEAAAANADPNTWTIDSFVGTGAAQTETLSLLPGSKSAILMTVDGIEQGDNAYSLDGKTVVFQTPSGGEEVRFRYGVRVITEGPAAGSIGTTELANLGVTTAKLADGSATKVKLAASSVDETKIDAARAANILSALGISKVKIYTLSSGLYTTSALSTETPVSDQFNVDAMSTTSKLAVFGIASAASLVKASSAADDAGGYVVLKYYNGTIYTTIGTIARLINNNISATGARQIDGSLISVAYLTPAHRRSDTPTRWTLRLYGTPIFADNTLNIPDMQFFAVEYE